MERQWKAIILAAIVLGSVSVVTIISWTSRPVIRIAIARYASRCPRISDINRIGPRQSVIDGIPHIKIAVGVSARRAIGAIKSGVNCKEAVMNAVRARVIIAMGPMNVNLL